MSRQRGDGRRIEGERERGSVYPEKGERIRSRQITAGPGRAPQRATFRAMGYDDEDLASPWSASRTSRRTSRRVPST